MNNIIPADNGGLRFNEGKRKWGLLSYVALAPLVQVLEFGAKKYAPFNWARGLSYTETFECLQRHAIAWFQGEEKDPETGLSHMAHVLCNAMFLMHFIATNTGTDDRHIFKEKTDNGNRNDRTTLGTQAQQYQQDDSCCSQPERSKEPATEAGFALDPSVGSADGAVRALMEMHAAMDRQLGTYGQRYRSK